MIRNCYVCEEKQYYVFRSMFSISLHYFTLKLDTICYGNKKLEKISNLARQKCQKCDYDNDDDEADDDEETDTMTMKLHKIQFRIRNSNQLLLARFEFNVFYLLYANDAVFSLSIPLVLLVLLLLLYYLFLVFR